MSISMGWQLWSELRSELYTILYTIEFTFLGDLIVSKLRQNVGDSNPIST